MAFSDDGQFLLVGQKKVSAVFDVASSQKIKILELACYDNGRCQKIVPRWIGNTLLGRWDKVVRVWKIAEDTKTNPMQNQGGKV